MSTRKKAKDLFDTEGALCYDGFTMNNTISPFDSGVRSEKNNLPLIPDIVRFLEHFLKSDPDKSYTRLDLIDAVAKEFQIPTMNQEVEGDSSTPLFHSRMNFIIADAVQGERADHVPGAPIVGKPWAKRLDVGVYQYIGGNGTALPLHRREVKVPKRLVEEARVSVRILKSLPVPHDPETIMVELGGRVWSDDVLEAAIKLEFKI